MRQLLLTSALSLVLCGSAFAQATGMDPEDEMLLEGTSPGADLQTPSMPPSGTDDGAGIDLATPGALDGEADATDETDGKNAAAWVGLEVVTSDGRRLGEIGDVIAGNDGTVETVVLQRADGGVRTVPVAALTNAGGELVADPSILR